MKAYLKLTALILTCMLAGCATTRRPVPAGEIPIARPVPSTEEQEGRKILEMLTRQYPLDRDDARVNRARDLVDRLTASIKKNQDPWHVYVLVGDDVRNAAATKGNHLFVWTGLLKTVQSDDELATVIAHEIGHILAGHVVPTSDEEANQAFTGLAGAITEGVMASQGSVGAVADLAGVLVQQVFQAWLVNPESQRKELEADLIGLHLMAEAGINPEHAVAFWARVRNEPYFSGPNIPILSSHPGSDERLQNLSVHLPEAMKRYRRASSSPGSATIPGSKTGSLEHWTVQESEVRIHAAPDMTSEVVGRLAFGDTVAVREKHHRWLEITEPVSGFVPGRYLSPEDTGRE